MEEGLLSLKWNNHNSTFFQNLSILREKHTYTDVTLACDGRLYPVHKFILSTCSEYFSDIFTSNSGNNIVIVLKDVRRQDLEYLLDYMYLGQVDVAQSELSSLIKTAECLKIKGLAIPDDEPQTPSRRGTDERDPDSSPPSKKKRHHADENRTVGVSSNSSNNISSRIQPILSIPPPSLPPHTVQQQQSLLQRLQVPVSQSQHPPTSQSSGKVHSSSLTHIASPRTLQVTTGSTHPSHVPPLSSPTQPSSMPLIKQEVTEPPESEYGNDSFEESKPDVSESQHLDQDMAIAGPSGIQGSADNWDGESDLSGFAGGDPYPEGGMEESGDSEAQGGSRTYPLFEDPGKFLPYSQDETSHHRRLTAHVSAPLLPSPTNQQHLVNPPLYAHSLLSTSGGKLISCREDTPAADSSSNTLPHPQSQFLDFPPLQTQSFEPQSPRSELQSIEAISQCLNMQPLESVLSPGKYQQAQSISKGKMFDCPYCTSVFNGRMEVENHVRNHSRGKSEYWCAYCYLKCKSGSGLHSHMKTQHLQYIF